MAPQTISVWTSGNVELLKTLVAEGHTAAYIAAILHTTRSAVIGKCHRKGLQLRSKLLHQPKRLSPAPRKAAFRPAKKIAPPPKPVNNSRPILPHHDEEAMSKRDNYHPPSAPIAGKLKDHFIAPPGKRTLSLLELRSSTCRWPLDVGKETRFCGDKTSFDVYCPHHRRLSGRRA